VTKSPNFMHGLQRCTARAAICLAGTFRANAFIGGLNRTRRRLIAGCRHVAGTSVALAGSPVRRCFGAQCWLFNKDGWRRLTRIGVQSSPQKGGPVIGLDSYTNPHFANCAFFRPPWRS